MRKHKCSNCQCYECANKIDRYKARVKKLKNQIADLDADNYHWSMEFGKLKNSIDMRIKEGLDYNIKHLPEWQNQEAEYWKEKYDELEKELNEMQRKYE